jgi:multidrug efflux pump subunit AcrA (membrane-fusion protein)
MTLLKNLLGLIVDVTDSRVPELLEKGFTIPTTEDLQAETARANARNAIIVAFEAGQLQAQLSTVQGQVAQLQTERDQAIARASSTDVLLATARARITFLESQLPA